MQIDVDDPRSWPEDVVHHVEEVATRWEIWSGPFSEFDIGPREDDEFRHSLLTDRLLVAYHATRLLPHEVESVRDRGLLSLSTALIEERAEAAHDLGHVTAEERDRLKRGNLLVISRWSVPRKDQVCLFLSQSVLDDRANQIVCFLDRWGGEVMYEGDHYDELAGGMLRSIGRPSVVEVLLDLSPPGEVHQVWPGLLRSFVGRWLGLGDHDASVHYHGGVPPEHIVGIWQPGDEFYDAHGELPRD